VLTRLRRLALGSYVSAAATWVILPLLSAALLLALEIYLLRGSGFRFPRVRRAFLPLNWLVIGLQFAGAGGLLQPSVCFIGLWWLVVHAATQFLVQVLRSLRSS